MAKLFQIGISYPDELASGIGHVAATLGGVNYECRGGDGCLKGSSARGASHALFRHHFHRVLSEAQALRAKRLADSCVGGPYDFGGLPDPPDDKSCDCSGYMSAIMCAADDIDPIRRLFATGTWKDRFEDLKFKVGLHGDFGERTIDLSRLLADIAADRVTADIGAVKLALNRKLGTSLSAQLPWGPKTREAYSRWRQRLGFQASIGVPGRYSLERLGFRVVA
jgi:hypothetical protein